MDDIPGTKQDAAFEVRGHKKYWRTDGLEARHKVTEEAVKKRKRYTQSYGIKEQKTMKKNIK
jgi:hypothetical protein